MSESKQRSAPIPPPPPPSSLFPSFLASLLTHLICHFDSELIIRFESLKTRDELGHITAYLVIPGGGRRRREREEEEDQEQQQQQQEEEEEKKEEEEGGGSQMRMPCTKTIHYDMVVMKCWWW